MTRSGFSGENCTGSLVSAGGKKRTIREALGEETARKGKHSEYSDHSLAAGKILHILFSLSLN